MQINSTNKVVRKVMSFINHYDHDKYWRRRNKVIDPAYQNKLFKLYYLLYVKWVDSHWNCTFGTGWNEGAYFATPPLLWHGPNGIIVAYNVQVGKNSIFCQRVTIGNGECVIIGDDVFVGSNVYIGPGVHIGNGVKIGANAVVVEDVPDNATVVMQKPRIILK